MKNYATLFFTITLLTIFNSDKLSAGDSVLKYSTYLGPRKDFVFYAKYVGIGVDKKGCAYVSTSIPEIGFPATPDACQKTRSETAITKLSADGSELIYSSFFGPPETWTRAYDMTVDDEGNAYLVGITDSEKFPATAGSYFSKPIGPYPRPYPHDGFLIKLDPTLKKVIYGTYLGDNSWDEVIAVALDSKGRAYATGDVGKDLGGRRIYKINSDGSNAVYEHATAGYPYDIAVDAKGCAYITGRSGTSRFKTTPRAYSRSFKQKTCDFVRKLDPSGNIVFSTYLRHGAGDVPHELFAGNSVAVDSKGCVYICRATEYRRELTTVGAFDTLYNGGHDVYVLKLDPTGSHAIWATYLGGTSDELPKDLTVDGDGNVYVTGRTRSRNFPTTRTALDRSHNGHHDMFLSVIAASGGKLLYSTVMGGKDYDTGQALVLDQHNSLYVAGTTRSAVFPTTHGAYKRTYSGYKTKKFGGDVFVCKFDFGFLIRSVK